MKKTVSVIASFALACSAAVVVPTSTVAAQGASPAVEVCKGNFETFGFDSVGDCVSAIRSGPPKTCKFIDELGLFPLTLGDGTVLKNRGQCVAYIRSIQNG